VSLKQKWKKRGRQKRKEVRAGKDFFGEKSKKNTDLSRTVPGGFERDRGGVMKQWKSRRDHGDMGVLKCLQSLLSRGGQSLKDGRRVFLGKFWSTNQVSGHFRKMQDRGDLRTHYQGSILERERGDKSGRRHQRQAHQCFNRNQMERRAAILIRTNGFHALKKRGGGPMPNTTW